MEQYEKIAKQFLHENYNIQLNIPIKRNNRLSASLGRFIYTKKGSSHIDLAGFLLDYGKEDTIIDVLKHECIHYAFYEKGLPFDDGEEEFEKELIKQQVSTTNSKRVGKYIQFECKTCKSRGETRNRRLIKRPQLYRTKCCHSPLSLITEKIYDGT